MTEREARLESPKLVPGIAAGTWALVVQWAWIGSGVLFVVGLVVQFVGQAEHVLPFAGLALVIAAVLVTVVLRLVGLVSLPNEKAEVRAGYTTLRRKYANLEQLDPKTGAVVRAAGEPYPPRSRRARDMEPTAQVGSTPRPSLLRRIGPTALALVGSAIFFVAVYALVGALTQTLLTALLIVWPSVVLIYAIAIGVGAIGVRRRLLRLQEAAPSELAFFFGTSQGLVSGLQALVPIGETADPQLTRSRQATASASAITFWKGNPPHPTAKLPWSKVIAVQYDTVRTGRYSYPCVIITYRDTEADEVVALPLINADANFLPIHSVAEARWIASELNQLRTSSTTARLI